MPCSLVELRQIYENHQVIEFTIAIPQRAIFLRMTSGEQQFFVKRLLIDTLKETKKMSILKYHLIFEATKNNNIHGHGLLWDYNKQMSKDEIKCYMSDFYKCMHRILTKIKYFKNIKYISALVWRIWKSQTPLLCLQYSNVDRCEVWYNYLTKCKGQVLTDVSEMQRKNARVIGQG